MLVTSPNEKEWLAEKSAGVFAQTILARLLSVLSRWAFFLVAALSGADVEAHGSCDIARQERAEV